jgi:light-regulated signal transduction histidine kinase (bacteriophytochrome)
MLESRLTGLHKNGATFPIEITISPFETGEGRLVTTAVRDATEKVEAEERIRRINIELEMRVADRTAELTRSNDALRQFAWAASHDLQEPARMVLTYVQWLAKSAGQKLEDKERGMLSCIEENGVRLQTLLSALRQYIFIAESGQESLDAVDCGVVLQHALDCLKAPIAEAGATVTHSPLPVIQSVEVLIFQLFENLISNALKYRSEEPPRIHVSAELVDRRWVFSVADNGIGISPEHSEYIFGVFKRLHGRQYSGTGIGLAICKAAVERLGGRIWVESKPGSGATFRFALPQKGLL